MLSNGSGADGKGGKTEVKDARVLYDARAVNLDFSMNLSAVGTDHDGAAGPQLAPGHQSVQSFWNEASQSYTAPDPSVLTAWDGILSYTVQTADGSTQSYATWAEAEANAAPSSLGYLRFQRKAMADSIVQEVKNAHTEWTSTHQTATVNLDLNKFLQTKDKMRLVWESES